jgi:hypothetical protein
MDSTYYPLVVGLVVAAVGWLHMLIRPEPIVRLYQNSASRDRSRFGSFNRRVFDSSRTQEVARTFRLVGALGLLLVAVIATLLWANAVA